jgi:hypothetical protein
MGLMPDPTVSVASGDIEKEMPSGDRYWAMLSSSKKVCYIL